MRNFKGILVDSFVWCGRVEPDRTKHPLPTVCAFDLFVLTFTRMSVGGRLMAGQGSLEP